MSMGYHPSLICNAPLGLPAKLTLTGSRYAGIPPLEGCPKGGVVYEHQIPLSAGIKCARPLPNNP